MALNAGAVVASFKGEVSGMRNAIADVKKDVGDLGENFNKLGSSLKNIGTTLSIAVTAPLVLFGKTSFDTAVQTESAWKRVQKVYDGTAASINDELMPAAKALSIEFGKNKLAVIDVMESLAAMGETGAPLIEKTRQAMHFAANGGMELSQAIDTVIATSAVFNVKGEELSKTLATMNTAENAGAASMADLGNAVSTVGNVSKASGVDVKELNAMMSVLRLRAVDATEGANALKTIFTRLRRPNETATAIMDKYGMTVETTGGKLKDADVILNDIAGSWQKMTDAEREELSFSLGTMFQKDKFLALMDDLSGSNSEYNRILQAQADDTANLATYNKELNIFLDQSETKVQQAKIAWAELKETFGKVIITAILPLLEKFKGLVSWIDQLSPRTQQFIVAFLAIAAALGPVLIILGTLITSIVAIGSAFSAVGGIIGAIALPAFLPLILIIGAVAIAIAALRQAWDNNTGGIRDKWIEIFNSLKPLWEQFILLLQMLQPVVTWLWQAVLAPFLTWIWNTFVTVFTSIVVMLTGAIQVIIGIFQLLANVVISVIAVLVAVVTGDWQKLTQLLIANAQNFKSGISNIFSGILSFFQGWGGAVYNALVQPFVDAYNKIKEMAQKIKEAASEINPFKKHSPSLVELVTKGTGQIADQYALLADKVGNMDFRATVAGIGDIGTNTPNLAMAGIPSKQVTINNYNQLQDSVDVQQFNESLAYQFRVRADL